MTVHEATKAYETWAGTHIELIGRHLRLKHSHMATAAMPFLRATFYRWVTLWQEVCPELAKTPKLLAVGDLHMENFGTWRDTEGRLVWGINDFDEAFPMPYAIDLVRLATSAQLAIRAGALEISSDEACAAILAGYSDVIKQGEGSAFVLEEAHPSLRRMALSEERNPVDFWFKLNALPTVKAPGAMRKLLRKQFPDRDVSFRIVRRIAGLGSLGRPRYVALAAWQGGMVAREAKAMLPSAYGWATKSREHQLFYSQIIERATRASDPFLTIRKDWLLRRIAPDCSRIALADFPEKRDERRILKAMGHETANVHLGTRSAIAEVRRDLKRRGKAWLHDAARNMADATLKDWKDWRKVHLPALKKSAPAG